MTTRWIGMLALLVAWALVGVRPSPAQPPLEPAAPGGIIEEDLGEDVGTLLAEAEEVFRSADQPDSIALFDRIVAVLERHRAEGTLDEQGEEWMKLSLFRRAEARSNLLEQEAAEADLTTIVRLDPEWRLPDGYVVSRLLSDLLSRVRDTETGVLDPLIDPPDAEIYLDGELLGPVSGPRRVLAGERLLQVRRAGHLGVEQPLTVPAGESVPLELTLERTSAVVRLATRPAGVEAVVGGRVVATGEPPADGGEEGSLTVEGLQPGEQLLVLRKAGYRPVEIRLQIAELVDYSMAPVVLERTRGTMTIARLPAGARVFVDGEPLPLAARPPSELRLDLAPGAHELRVEAGAAGLFESRFELADREEVAVEVRLRPGLVLLGVLGGDRVAAAELETRLGERLGALSEWAAIQRAERGFDLLREAGIDRHRLRDLAAGSGAAEPPDWAALQQALDGDLVGSAYLLAVLSDDLYASRADLWLWSAAPGPVRPVRRQVSLGDAQGLEELAAALDRPLRLSSSWVGARFVDSPAADAPVVLSVTAGGPAAAAGLSAGDTVGALDGRAVSGARDLRESLAALPAGREVVLQVAGAAADRSLTLTLGESPVVASLSDPSALDPALAARLASLEASADERVPGWLVRLNRGVVLMRRGEWRRAAAALRGLEAPAGAGIGQATIDYLLGVALLEVDRAAYRDTALDLIGRAADGDARLEHNDGPLLAPRARARLETLLRQ